uniref:Uncharacterized protein n=1 Tax=Tanacetum cinerariifolium TaxID=118510 RepID=A0A6L2NZ30_TANCI|nr:hypothetical protein [Tanacetum cinerariifolium]
MRDEKKRLDQLKQDLELFIGGKTQRSLRAVPVVPDISGGHPVDYAYVFVFCEDMNDGCDITVEDVERLRKILTPSIHTLPNLEPMVQPYMPQGLVCNKEKVKMEEEHDYDIPLQDHVMQPLTPQTAHIPPPDDDYVAPATNLILNNNLNEFGEEFNDNARVSKKIDSNTVNDLKELLKTYDFETFIRKLLHQLSQSSHETGKAKRKMKSHQ